jgi:hypothetical protein
MFPFRKLIAFLRWPRCPSRPRRSSSTLRVSTTGLPQDFPSFLLCFLTPNSMLSRVGTSLFPKWSALPNRTSIQLFSAQIVSGPLTSSEVENYARNGFLVPQWHLSESELQKGRVALNELLRNNPHVQPELLVNSHIDNSHNTRENESGTNVRGHRAFLDLASSPSLVDMVAQVLETNNVILWACQVRINATEFKRSVCDFMRAPRCFASPLFQGRACPSTKTGLIGRSNR